MGILIERHIYLATDFNFFVFLDVPSMAVLLPLFGGNPGLLCCLRTAFLRFIVSPSAADIIKSTAWFGLSPTNCWPR